jgi:hypothetical protein
MLQDRKTTAPTAKPVRKPTQNGLEEMLFICAVNPVTTIEMTAPIGAYSATVGVGWRSRQILNLKVRSLAKRAFAAASRSAEALTSEKLDALRCRVPMEHVVRAVDDIYEAKSFEALECLFRRLFTRQTCVLLKFFDR